MDNSSLAAVEWLLGLAAIRLAVFARRAAASLFKCFIETAKALKASSQRNVENRIGGRDQKALRVSDPVLRDEGGDRGAECFPKQVHRIIWVQVVGFGDHLGGERFMVMARDVAGQPIGARECWVGMFGGRKAGYSPSQPQQPGMHLQANGAFTNRIAVPQF